MNESPQANRKPRVLIATLMGGYDHARVLDTVLAQALDVRGAEVEVLLCNAAIPACQMMKAGRVTAEQLAAGEAVPYCGKCLSRGRGGFEGLGYPINLLGEQLTDEDRIRAEEIARTTPADELRTFELNGVPIGDHAHAGALRFFARGDLEGEAQGEAVLRRYLQAGLLTVAAMRRLIQRRGYDIIVANHGIYVPQGMICEVARSMGVRVVTYNPAYRKHSFVFSHDQSYHFTMLDEPAEHWRDLVMTPKLAEDTRRYLNSRRFGSNDWIWFHDQPREDIAPVLREAGADPGKPYVALLTSVVWDAQLHYKANAFPNMVDWLKQTVAYWAERQDDLQLVIRVHPAEIRGAVPSRQKAADELAKTFPDLPDKVFVLGPENQASTYALCENANAVIIFNTKAGVEMSAMGVPVIVAGEAWIRGKGFAVDVSSPEDYFSHLDALPQSEGLSREQKALADKYAYHFFFRRMIPLPFIQQEGANFRLAIGGKQDLAAGRWPGLDAICDGILDRRPFIYPAETLEDPFPGEAAAEASA
jgi:hypothetical protein